MACILPACTCNDVNTASASRDNASGTSHNDRGSTMCAVAVPWSRTTRADPHSIRSDSGVDVAVTTGQAGSPAASSITSATMCSDPPTSTSDG